MQFKAASLSAHKQAWQNINAPDYLLQWITEGVPIPFVTDRPAFHIGNRDFSRRYEQFVSEELRTLLQTGVISETKKRPTCVSGIGVVPKQNKQLRLIVDLRRLNSHCSPPKFRYEDIENVCELVEPHDQLITLDLKNGFYHVPVKPAHRTYLGIQWKGRYYVFNVLPFGANFSPYYFCKILRYVVQHLREQPQSLRLGNFVDDFLLMAYRNTFLQDKDCLLSTLQSLGWFVNWDKSSLEPSTNKVFIGYNVLTDTKEGVPIIKITAQRIHKLKRDARKVLNNSYVSARVLARVAGQCISMTKVVLPAKLLLRNVYRVLKQRTTWQSQLYLDTPARKDLEYWLGCIEAWNGRVSTTRPVDVQAVSDASSTGWGFACLNREAAGFWDQWMSTQPSNYREMQAVLMGLLSFKEELSGKSVQILSDNVSTVANINFQGGPSASLTGVARAIWSVALKNNITLSLRFLRGVDNVHADALSRLEDKYGWKLHPVLFQALDDRWGPHTVDRFADMNNTQLQVYNSRYKDPHSSGVDALSQRDWAQHNNWVCPPFRLVPRVLQVLREQKAVATVVAPWWPAQPHHQLLLTMSIAPPIRLPMSMGTVLFNGEWPEPLRNCKWRVFAWRVSGVRDLET